MDFSFARPTPRCAGLTQTLTRSGTSICPTSRQWCRLTCQPIHPSMRLECEAVVYQPADVGEGLILSHGGGWAFMDLDTHERFSMRPLSIEARTTLIGIQYRLAPEHPSSRRSQGYVSALRQPRAARCPRPAARPVVIAGDPGGGANLALATMLHEIDVAGCPAGGLLFHGVFGADFETPSYQTFADAQMLTRPIMQQLWTGIKPEVSCDDPLAAPNNANDDQLRALPPVSRRCRSGPSAG